MVFIGIHRYPFDDAQGDSASRDCINEVDALEVAPQLRALARQTRSGTAKMRYPGAQG